MEGHVSVGHPVDVASGVFFTAAHDVILPGVFPLVWRRAYSTGLLTYDNSPLGPGWIHFFDIWLERTPRGFLLFAHDGSRIAFKDPHHTVDQGAVVLNAAASMDIRLEGDRYAVYHWHGWDGDIKKFLFKVEPGGVRMLLDSVENPQGQGLKLNWDKRRLLRVTQTVEGKGIQLGYDASGRIASVAAFAPGVERPAPKVRYQYSPSGRLVVATNAAGADQVFAYDDRGSMLQETGHGGTGTFLMRYDKLGRCVEVNGEDGYQHRRLDFDPANRVTRVTDSLGHVTAYLFNERGQVLTIRHPDGGVVHRTFDDEHRLATQTDTIGRVTSHEYDTRGNRVATVIAGRRSEFTFDDRHQVLSVSKPGGARWIFERSAELAGRLESITEPAGGVTRFEYDARGILVRTLDPNGYGLRIEHAADWSSETYSDDIGLVLRRILDPWQRTVREEDARGLRQGFEYDAMDRAVRRYEPLGAAWNYTFDAADNVVEQVNPAGHKVALEYGPHGQLTRFTDPNGIAHVLEYDSEGRTIAVTNPNGERSETAHDAMGRVIRETGFDGRVTAFEYDVAGRVIRKIKPGGQALDFEYDDRDALLTIRAGDRIVVKRSYDEAGNLVRAEAGNAVVEAEWDAAGRLTAEIQNGRRVSYTRNATGSLRALALEGGPGAMEFDLDLRGRLKEMRAGGIVRQSFSFDAADVLTARAMGPAVELLGYDERRRIVDQEITGEDGSTIYRQSFGYDRAGNLARIAGLAQETREFRYDAGKRLIESTATAKPGAEPEVREFAYDDCGNLKSRPGMDFAHGPGSEMTAMGNGRLEYNPAGLPVRLRIAGHETTFHWDDLDQLIEVRTDGNSVAKYEYDALGRRTSKVTAAEGETRFHWAGDHLLCESSSRGEAKMFWTPGMVPGMSWTGSGQIEHYINGQNDVPTATLNASGAISGLAFNGEFGECSPPNSPAATFRLAGQYLDRETGFHYNRFRYYLPTAGRFLSPDPMGPDGGLNPFVFAPNAMGFADPLGLTCGKTGCPVHAVYVLKDKHGTVLYVGITMQDPQERCDQHRQHKDFAYMEIIANGLTRREARNIEGSALYHIKAGTLSKGNANHINMISPLLNERRLDGGYYHSYSPGDPVRPILHANTTAAYLRTTGIATYK